MGAVQAALHKPAVAGQAPIITWSKSDIEAWATRRTCNPDGAWHYTHRGPQLWADPARLDIAMAVLCRSIHLAHGFLPRDTQLATILLIVRDGIAEQELGKLAQVATGEGKSVIIAGVAILKALGGLGVDIITTSRILAERDAAENATLYAMFDLQVSNNCDDACEYGMGNHSPDAVRRERYFRGDAPVDIVYGDASAFERDELLTSFHPHDPQKQIIHARFFTFPMR
ncbi:MAG: hypothetical protein EOO38_33005 [Cytophagaceae bacterium]|nr:MAG: hypothetical protein EOO38_33005 [Cytophagaceae bacterium]